MGSPRLIGASRGEGDISHDGRRIATFQTQDNHVVLAIYNREDRKIQRVRQLPTLAEYGSPRWSPDDRSIAFAGAIEIAFNRAIYVMDADDGEAKTVVNAQNIRGLAWLPDGSGIVYASSAGSTMTYPPIFNLRAVSRDGSRDRQLTFGDVSYIEPDVAAAGKLFASRVRMESDIWRFPVDGSPSDNVKNASSDYDPDRSGADAVSRVPMERKLFTCRTAAVTPTHGSPRSTARALARLLSSATRRL